MPQTVKVKRHSFFDAPEGGHLRWTESAPPGPPHGFECGCTKNAHVRPPGSPTQVNQQIEVGDERGTYELRGDWLTFGRRTARDPHSYFIFRPNERSIQIEITLPGYKYADHFFANLYWGRDIDTSRFMNGHAPTRLDVGREVRHDDLWVHECCWGKEALKVLRDPQELQLWRHAHDLVTEIRLSSIPLMDKTVPVEQIREAALLDQRLLGNVKALMDLLEPVHLNVRATELFSAAHWVSNRVESLPKGTEIN